MTELKRFEEIVEHFVELKNTSELMLDLAYSSLMLNSKELAGEVQRLEEYVDQLHTDFELLALTSDFKKEEASGFLGLIRLGVATEKIADAAAEMAEVVLRGVEPHPVLKLAIKEAEETVTQVCVTEGSPLVNKTLKEARVHEETGMWILVRPSFQLLPWYFTVLGVLLSWKTRQDRIARPLRETLIWHGIYCFAWNLPLFIWSANVYHFTGNCGLSHQLGASLTNHTGAFMEMAPAEYGILRDRYVEEKQKRGGNWINVFYSISGNLSQ